MYILNNVTVSILLIESYKKFAEQKLFPKTNGFKKSLCEYKHN